MKIQMRNNLPKGWVWVKLGDICLQPQYGWTTRATPQGSLRLLRTTDITSGKINWNSVPFCEKEPPEIEKYLLKDGDIVISRAGSVGFSSLIENAENTVEAVFASYLIRFRTLINAYFVGYFLKSPLYWKSISEKKLGIAVPNVNASKLKQIPIPLPPLPEQHRIVTKIEELFTKLDAGVEALKKIKKQIKQYRQSILKYAFEGKLTEKWQAKNQNSPKKLAQAKLCDCAELITKGESPKWQGFDYVDEGVPFIRSENVLWGTVDVTNTAKIPHEFHKKLSRSQLKPYDVLVNLVGASIGRCGIIPENLVQANINQAVALIRVNNILNSEFLMYLLLSPSIQKRIHEGKVETARPNISLKDLRQIDIPLPNMEEQQKIVEEIEKRFSVADGVEKVIEQSLKQAEQLRQSILKNAFEGKLVPQDPSDEPAEKLLERIKAEKERLKREKKVGKKRKKKGRRGA